MEKRIRRTLLHQFNRGRFTQHRRTVKTDRTIYEGLPFQNFIVVLLKPKTTKEGKHQHFKLSFFKERLARKLSHLKHWLSNQKKKRIFNTKIHHLMGITPSKTATISSFCPMGQFPTMIFPLLALRGEESP